MATKIIDLSAFIGYEGKNVSMKEPTGTDMLAVTDFMNRDKKSNGGEPNMLKASIYLLSLIIKDAPFATDVNSLSNLPFKLLNYLADEAGELISPLPKKNETV